MLALRGPGDATSAPPAALTESFRPGRRQPERRRVRRASRADPRCPGARVGPADARRRHATRVGELDRRRGPGRRRVQHDGDEVPHLEGQEARRTSRSANRLDPNGVADILVRLYRVDGVPASDLLTSIIDAWKVDNSDMTVTDATLAGKPVKKGDFPSAGTVSYWYIEGDHVFDIQSNDPAIAASALEAILSPGASPAASGSNGASTSPPPSTGASALPSAVPSAS